tara:strand:+ start:3050 stop:3781 length:732 start_codon:yes stop_codon:yes gene_type:complete
MNIIVYTVISGNYDKKLIEPKFIDENINYFCFTDNTSFKSKTWKIVPIENILNLERNDQISRYYKFLSHKVLPPHNVSIYIDGNIEIISSLNPFINEFLNSNKVFGCLEHPQRENLLQEIIACHLHQKFKHDDCHKIYEQVLFYEQEKFSLLSKLYAATILVKKDSEKTNELSENWWNIVQSYTCRDQISLSYSLWKTKITPYVFSLNILEKNPYFNRRPHSTSLFYHLKKKIKYSLRSLKLK